MGGCPRCGEYNPHRANYCMFCGQNLRERSIKIADGTLRHLVRQKNEMLYRLVASLVVAGFLLYLLSVAYVTGYYADYFGRGVVVVLVILLAAAAVAVAYYYPRFKKVVRYLRQEMKRGPDE
ncbi:MAG TPA: zinc ribbon domain-containing protein [Thermoplasmatales archaeon]|nr:zinc ribbon domain-containing protein [Candidatus Thermoplasmatota archaeon]HDS59127.1 zinc ribbon domain-containing protein [Thermoplasmatales archaeon]